MRDIVRMDLPLLRISSQKLDVVVGYFGHGHVEYAVELHHGVFFVRNIVFVDSVWIKETKNIFVARLVFHFSSFVGKMHRLFSFLVFPSRFLWIIVLLFVLLVVILASVLVVVVLASVLIVLRPSFLTAVCPYMIVVTLA